MDIFIEEGMEKMDFERVASMLGKAFWSEGISIEEVKKGALNSALVAGAFLSDRTQIGYARVISDKTRFAYILDVYVDEAYRGKGAARMLIEYILSSEELKDVYQWALITKDTHDLYRKFGFETIADATLWMEIRHPRPER